MVNKKLVIIISVIFLIIVVAVVCVKLKIDRNIEVSSTENQAINDMANSVEENKIENETKENVEIENKVENTEKENVSTENTSNTQIKEQEPDDKAVSLVKKKWGEKDSSVYYYIEEQISDDEYIISVRDQDTTQELASYQVNIETGKVSKN